jgi:hypothetical protein
MYPKMKTAIKEMQSAAGVKDRLAQHWLEHIFEKVAAAFKADPSRSHEDVADEVREWLHDQPGDKINPLLFFAGMF